MKDVRTIFSDAESQGFFPMTTAHRKKNNLYKIHRDKPEVVTDSTKIANQNVVFLERDTYICKSKSGIL